MNDNAGGSRFRWPLMMAYWRFFRRGRCSIVRAFSCPGNAADIRDRVVGHRHDRMSDRLSRLAWASAAG